MSHSSQRLAAGTEEAVTSRECDLGYEQHNRVTPSAPAGAGSRPRAPAPVAGSTSHIPCWNPRVPGCGWGGSSTAQPALRTSPSTDQTGQGQHMLHARSPPTPQGLSPSKMKCSSSVRGEELRAEARTGHVHTHAEMAQRRMNTLRHDRDGSFSVFYIYFY